MPNRSTNHKSMPCQVIVVIAAHVSFSPGWLMVIRSYHQRGVNSTWFGNNKDEYHPATLLSLSEPGFFKYWSEWNRYNCWFLSALEAICVSPVWDTLMTPGFLHQFSMRIGYHCMRHIDTRTLCVGACKAIDLVRRQWKFFSTSAE